MGELARIAAWRAHNGWHRHLVGAFDGSDLVGMASAQIAPDTPDTCWVDVAVHPRAQRHGVGMRLARSVEDSALPDVDRFVASAYRPTTAAIDELVEGFAQRLGYRSPRRDRVKLDLAHAELVAGVPDGLRADVGVFKGLVDAEAPNGELDCAPLAADPARAAQIEGTLVLGEHRGHGLGRAVKVASLRAAREHGRATRVRTSSDDENVWMRRINADLGFVPVESEVIVHRRR